MCFENARRLGIYPMAHMVKIGDTLADIAEGLNAGMWTIGLSKTGSELGLTEAESAALPPAELNARLAAIKVRMIDAGAHYVAESLADCAPILDAIDARLADSSQPYSRTQAG
jgi:phosphonoacetaldehyde hydrolase